MGLLGDSFDDPRTLATFNLAAGLLSGGNIGQSAMRGLAGYQGSMQSAAELAQKQQALEIQNIALQQAIRKFNLTMPLYEQAARYFGGGAPQAAAAGAPAPGSAPVSGPAPSATIPGGAPSAAATGAAPSAPAAAPQGAQQPAQTSTLYPNVPDNVALTTLMSGDLSKLADVVAKYNEPTEFAKTLAAAGIQQGSPLYQQLMQANIAHTNYTAPINARPGAIIRDPFNQKPLAFNPHVPEGGTPVFDASGNVTAINPLQGAAGVIGQVAAAKAGGEGSMIPYAGVDASGNPLPITSRTAAATQGRGAPASPLAAAVADAKATAGGNAQYNIGGQTGTITNGVATPGAIYAAPPMGAQTTAEESSKDAVASYNDLHQFATSSAPRNISLLQSIEALAGKTMVGPGASKVQFVNGVLNTLGITPGADQAQNFQIMKKNLNMLVGSQRLAAQGGGSDALQTLIESANPNVSEMNGPAAAEAAQELIAYNRMMIAQDRAMPKPLTVPTAQFQQAQTDLARFRDPRLWQLEYAQSDAERARILSLMPPADRQQLLQKASQARQLGLFGQ